MKRRSICQLLFVLLFCCSVSLAIAQAQETRGRQPASDITHTIMGDFKIDESNAGPLKPSQFRVILADMTGRPLSQQTVGNNSRYGFNNVAPGEYNLIVEMDGVEVQRIPVVLQGIYKTDFKKDILLEWQKLANSAAARTTFATTYARAEANQKLLDKALAASNKNDQKQAGTLLNQIVSSDTKDYEAWTELGTVYFKQEKFGDAEKAYRQALAEKPLFFLALFNLGKTQIAQKNFEGSTETLTKAVEANPKSATANFFLGESYLQIKKGSKAVGYLNEAIKLDPVGMADAHLRLGVLYRGAGLKEKAVAEFEQFLAKKPNYPEKAALEQYIKENKQK